MLHQRKGRYFAGRRQRVGDEVAKDGTKDAAAGERAANTQETAPAGKRNTTMKTQKLIPILGLLAIASAVFLGSGLPNAGATPGKGGTKFDLSTKTYPNQCATIQETRTLVNASTGPGGLGVDAGGGFPVPVSPLSSRNKLFLCNSPETYVYTDAGTRAAVKCRVDGAPVFTGATNPGIYLPTPPIAITETGSAVGQSCIPFELTIWNADGGGGSGPTCVALDNLTDGGPAVAVDVVECAY